MTDIITAASEADVQAALRGEGSPVTEGQPPHTHEAPLPVTEGPSWDDVSEEDQSKHIVAMVEECLEGATSNNPAMWIWVPPGQCESFRALWEKAMGQALEILQKAVPDEGPGSEVRKLYYPEVREHEECRIPNVLTFEKKLDHDLGEYLLSVGAWAGVSVENIHNAINIEAGRANGWHQSTRIAALSTQKPVFGTVPTVFRPVLP